MSLDVRIPEYQSEFIQGKAVIFYKVQVTRGN